MPPVLPIPADNLDFAWDRPETASSLRARLAEASPTAWLDTVAWIMGEARVEQVWDFLTLRQVADMFARVSPLLGRRRSLWEYILKVAHELGRI